MQQVLLQIFFCFLNLKQPPNKKLTIRSTHSLTHHFTSFPQIISALDGLDNKRPKINTLVERSKEVAKALSSLSALTIPEPHTNGFLVFLKGDKDKLNHEVKSLTEQTGLTLFREISYYPNSKELIAEVQIGHAHEQITTDEIVNYFEALVSASG